MIESNSGGDSFEGLGRNLTAVIGDDVNIKAQLEKGYDTFAVCFDTSSGTVYVGDGHVTMLRLHPIPEDKYIKGTVQFDDRDNADITHLWDMRTGTKGSPMESPSLKRKIAAAIRRDILGQRD